MESNCRGTIKYQSALKVLLKKQPQAAIELFEHSISTNEQPIDSGDFLIIFDYELFYQEGMMSNANENQTKEIPTDLQATAAIQHCDEMAVHRAILKYDTGDILKHPLSESFLHIKWQLTKNVLYANLVYFTFFVIVLSSGTVFEAYLLKCNTTLTSGMFNFHIYKVPISKILVQAYH